LIFVPVFVSLDFEVGSK